MKRLLSIILVLVIFLAFFASCDSPEEGETECAHEWARTSNLNDSTARDRCARCGEERLYTDPDRIGQSEGEMTTISPERLTETETIREAIPDLNMATLISLVEIYGSRLSWDQLSPYYYTDESTETIFRLRYQIDADFYLLVGGSSMDTSPYFIKLFYESDSDMFIDVRYSGIENFLERIASAKPRETVVLEIAAENLMESIEADTVLPISDMREGNIAATNFALELLRAVNDGERSTFISPVSVLYALAMTANGAKGETRAEIEAALGMSVEELNAYLYSYMAGIEQGEKYKLNIANSIWFTSHDRFTVEQDFLQKNADYYGADIYRTAFDEQTLKDINNWVEYHTDGLIKNALDKIPPEAVAYIINALLFEAEWADTYNEYSVYDGKFTLENGTEIDMELMYSEESRYLEDENATGFIKYYCGGYAFAAILPKEGLSVADYIAALDGESLNSLLSVKRYEVVYATMPKFKTEFSVELSQSLKALGIEELFSASGADLSALGRSDAGNIYISRVIHKTYIEVAEQGTKAGAVTIMEAKDECEPMDPKIVRLDRPFLYMIIDTKNNIPIFIGTMMGQ